MNVYLLTDNDGNAWGLIAADDEFEAVEMLLDDVEERTDTYHCQPDRINVEQLH